MDGRPSAFVRAAGQVADRLDACYTRGAQGSADVGASETAMA